MPALPGFLKNMPELKLDESKKKILLIYAAALLFVILLYFFFFLKPSVARLFELIPKVAEINMDMKSVNDDLLLEDRLKKKLQALEEELGEYEKRLSREKEIPMLLENLSKIARSSRVKILSITPSSKTRNGRTEKEKKGEGVYQEVPIAITAQSGYHELGTFINRLENNERYMQVSNMKIKSGKPNPKRHDVELVVYAYTFKK